MRREDLMVACVILRDNSQYYAGQGWDNNVNRASLFSLSQAEQKLKDLRPANATAVIACVLQNKNFDYYDGQKFVYHLLDAKLYAREEIERVLERLVAERERERERE